VKLQLRSSTLSGIPKNDVGTGVNWSTVDFVDFTDADLSDPVKADLPDIS
jgi:hypothetical protein